MCCAVLCWWKFLNLGGGSNPPLLRLAEPRGFAAPNHSAVHFGTAQTMAEGFTPVDYATDIRLSEVKGKRLWLVRVPRHIDPARLEVSIVCGSKHHSLVCGLCTQANALLPLLSLLLLRRWGPPLESQAVVVVGLFECLQVAAKPGVGTHNTPVPCCFPPLHGPLHDSIHLSHYCRLVFLN